MKILKKIYNVIILFLSKSQAFELDILKYMFKERPSIISKLFSVMCFAFYDFDIDNSLIKSVEKAMFSEKYINEIPLLKKNIQVKLNRIESKGNLSILNLSSVVLSIIAIIYTLDGDSANPTTVLKLIVYSIFLVSVAVMSFNTIKNINYIRKRHILECINIIEEEKLKNKFSN